MNGWTDGRTKSTAKDRAQLVDSCLVHMRLNSLPNRKKERKIEE